MFRTRLSLFAASLAAVVGATACLPTEATAPSAPPDSDPVVVGDDPAGSTPPGETASSAGAPASGEVTASQPAPTTRPAETGSAAPVEVLPELVVGAGSELDEQLASAKASNDFRAVVQATDLESADLAVVASPEGETVHVARFVADSALPARPEFAGLFDGSLAGALLAEPTYTEEIVVMDDHLLVDRRIVFAPDAAACARPGADPMCFSIDTRGGLPPDVAGALDDARARLAGRSGDAVAAPGVTVAEARAMTDEQLLGLMLNAQPRTIRRLSTLPIVDTAPANDVAVADHLVPGTLTAELRFDDVGDPTPRLPDLRDSLFTGPPAEFDTRYFVTGFTWDRSYGASWDYTFAEASWWHDRYYVEFSYDLVLAFGLRAPFSVDVEYVSGGRDRTELAVAVDPVNVDENGAPAFGPAGLPTSSVHGGDEFVLEARFDCTFTVSIPGPDPKTRTCDELGLPELDESRSIDPVIGDDETNIADWWLDGDTLGLGFDLGVVHGSLDVGAGLDVTNGRIGLTVSDTTSGVVTGEAAGRVWYDDESPRDLTVTRTGDESAFEIGDPQYGFDLTIRPKVRINVGVDTSVYENDWSWTVPLDFLGISAGFVLGHHDGTNGSYRYGLEWPAPVVAQTPVAGGVVAGG